MPSVPQEHFAEINSADVQMYTCKNTTAGSMHDISLIIAIASSECSSSAHLHKVWPSSSSILCISE